MWPDQSAWRDVMIETKSSDLDDFAIVLMVLIVIFFCVMASLIIWCVSLLSPAQFKRILQEDEQKANELLKDVQQNAWNSSAFLLRIEALIECGTPTDRRRVKELLDKLDAIWFNPQDGGASGAVMRLPRRAWISKEVSRYNDFKADDVGTKGGN